MNIYLSIEIKNRDFFSRFLLGCESALKGNEVFIGDINSLAKKNLLKPGIYHDKSLTPTNNRISKLKHLKKKNFVVTTQDEEAGHLNESSEEYINSRYGKQTLDLTDCIFTWGRFDYLNLTKNYKNYKKKFYNTGNPRIDFWREDFKKFFNKKKKKYILISSNFGTVFGLKNLCHQYKVLYDLEYFKRGVSENLLLERMTIESTLIENLFLVLKKIAKKYKKVNFLFRPHPLENSDDIKFVFKDYNNIVVENKGSLSEMISNARIVIHNGCTGGLEAAVRSIPTISFMPINKTTGHTIANRSGIKCKNEISLIKLINKYYKDKKKNYKPNNYKEIKIRLENLGEVPSFKKIVKIWERFKTKERSIQNNQLLISLYCNYRKIRKKFSSNPIYNSKFRPFKFEEVNEHKQKLEIIYPEFKKVSFKIIGDKLVYLHKID